MRSRSLPACRADYARRKAELGREFGVVWFIAPNMTSRSATGNGSSAGGRGDQPTEEGSGGNPLTGRAGWQLSPRAFERFLDSLHSERDVAAERYEQLRVKLIRFFEWRGCAFPDEHADETVTRVMRKLDEGEHIQDCVSYCYGVARLVLLEARKNRHRELDVQARYQPAAPLVDEGEFERRLDCLRKCMSTLALDHQTLIVEYHRHESADRIASRLRLATSLGIRMNALRIRVHRLTERLAHCVQRCARQEGA
jgi:DNA-directed RNA polymerase specialized sigma24 family protein